MIWVLHFSNASVAWALEAARIWTIVAYAWHLSLLCGTQSRTL
jgi:hypothetical protein